MMPFSPRVSFKLHMDRAIGDLCLGGRRCHVQQDEEEHVDHMPCKSCRHCRKMCWSSEELEYVGQKRNFGGRRIAVAFPCSCHLRIYLPINSQEDAGISGNGLQGDSWLSIANEWSTDSTLSSQPKKYTKKVLDTQCGRSQTSYGSAGWERSW